MHLHHFKINELEYESGRPTFKERTYVYYMRRFWHFYKNRGEDKSYDFSLETVIRRRPKFEFAWTFSIGNAGSETPFDGHITFLGSSIFWTTSVGRKLAQRLTETKEDKYVSRVIGWRIFDGKFWWDFWSKKHEWSSRNPKWMNFVVSIDPRVWIWGELKWTRTPIVKFDTTLDMPEADYPCTLTLELGTLQRKKGKKLQKAQYSIDVDVPKGVPSHFDKSGGWKGDRTYGYAVPFYEPDWVYEMDEGKQVDLNQFKHDARTEAMRWVFEQRIKTGFTEPQKQDD